MSESDRVNGAVFSYYERLGNVRSFVEQNLAEPIGVPRAAKVAGLSPGYFGSFFKAKTGVRFDSWLASLRIERAKERLCRRNESITQLAYSLGFRELRTFERSFKRVTGQSPQAFKRSHRPG
ncbi:MAG: helix-turn-helix transcriptional regulator [bacterium]|nr:helix-turn-helix transcriptional regulator [bacterium]